MIRSLILTLSACVLFSGTAMAAELNVGVADFQQVGVRSEANAATKKQYETMLAKEGEAMGKAQEAFLKKRSNFKPDPKWDQKTFESRVNALNKEGQELSEKEMQHQQRMNAILNSVNNEIGQLALEAAAVVAKEKGLDLILAQNSTLFADSSLDVTEEVLTAMNRMWQEKGSPVFGLEAEQSNPAPKFDASKPQAKPAQPAKSDAKKK